MGGSRWAACLALVTAIGLPVAARAHFGPTPVSLAGVPVPPVPGLVDGPDPIIVDPAAAIVLGKALFWDVNVGSDGVACATCHFHAGADARTKNQLAPEGKNPLVHAPLFDPTATGASQGPNATLGPADFPFFQTVDPLDPLGVFSPTFVSDDVFGSAGSFGGAFDSVSPSASADVCARSPDADFEVNGTGVRRAEPRNAPTVINAVFNFRNLWDGAANNVFNGSSPWGDRDPNAGVWVRTGPSTVEHERLALVNSSLASQALMPPMNAIEMACEGRTFADLGRKLAGRTPLEGQSVHWADGVLGPLSTSTPGQLRPGLATDYATLIRQAFAPRYWDYAPVGAFGAPSSGDTTPYSQLEANFAMFFALAIQLYESTLVSDQSPFDQSATDTEGIPIDLDPLAQDGFTAFRVGHCALCHIGPLLTPAAVETNAVLVESDPLAFGNETFTVSTSHNVVTRLSVVGGPAFVDTGFANNGLEPDAHDAGLGGLDPFGHPLSFSDQYLELLAGNPGAVVDAPVAGIRACDLELPIARDQATSHPAFFTQVEGVIPQPQDTTGCFDPLGAFLPSEAAAAAELASPTNTKMRSASRGSFKIPSLRNVELTGPYMHDGSMATLEQVLEFYTRGGSYEPDAKHFGTVFPQVELRFIPGQREAIIAFLESLTDERVRYERAPFDHPELVVPHGHVGDDTSVSAGSPLDPSLAQDEWLVVPAVGAGGRPYPLEPFAAHLVPEPSFLLGAVWGCFGVVLAARVAAGRRRARSR
ncbi:MAG: cytochrome-c peroxidase [Myxococcales bacterium]|nr:cytochrome-c peroxidase [Myxococcales bacterium]